MYMATVNTVSAQHTRKERSKPRTLDARVLDGRFSGDVAGARDGVARLISHTEQHRNQLGGGRCHYHAETRQQGADRGALRSVWRSQSSNCSAPRRPGRSNVLPVISISSLILWSMSKASPAIFRLIQASRSGRRATGGRHHGAADRQFLLPHRTELDQGTDVCRRDRPTCFLMHSRPRCKSQCRPHPASVRSRSVAGSFVGGLAPKRVCALGRGTDNWKSSAELSTRRKWMMPQRQMR